MVVEVRLNQGNIQKMSPKDGFNESLQSEFETHSRQGNSDSALQNEKHVFEIARLFFLKIRTLWRSRFLLFAFVLAGAVLGAIASWSYAPSASGTIVIRPVSSTQITKFASLNVIKSLGNLAVADEVETTTVEKFVTQKGLLNSFVFEFRTQPFLKNALAKHFAGNGDQTGISNERLLSLLSNHTLEMPTKRVSEHVVKFRTNRLKESKLAIKEALSKTNEKVKTELLASINNLIVAVEFGIENQKTTTQQRIQQERELYRLTTQNRLAFLQEQAKIARDLGVVENRQDPVVTAEASGNGSKSNQVTILNGDTQLFYLRGYKAIEKEIATLQQRDQSEINLYIKTLPNLILRLEALQNDNRVQRIRKAIELSNLNSENFQAVIYDVDTTSVSKGLPGSFFFLLAILLGLFAGVVFILLRPSYLAAKL